MSVSSQEIQSLTPEQPWPGLMPFTEQGAAFFRGREEETTELIRLIKRGMLTTFFGQSGLGKSSLIRAGAMPLLRNEGYFPIYIRLDHSLAAPHPLEQVRSAIVGEAAAHRIDAVAPTSALSLWEYFHTKRHEFWNDRNQLLTALLIFDQFEEIFTLGHSSAEVLVRTSGFVRELADLVENRIPEVVSVRAETDPAYVQGINYDRDVCKVLVTLREDFLPDFEGLRREIPSSIQNRMRLKAMNGRQALRAVKDTGARLVTQAVAEQIVHFVAGPRADHRDLEWERIDIEPALLSVVCRELNNRRLRDGATEISGEMMVSGAQSQIIAEFYERSFEGLDPGLKLFVEDRLLTASGHRNSIALEDATAIPGVTREGIDRLISRRVIRLEERFGALRVELTHDLLTRVIRENRDLRAARAAQEAAVARARQEVRRFRRLTFTAVVLGAGFIAMGLLLLKSVRSERLLAESSRAVLSQKLAATSRLLIQREPDVGWLLAVEAFKVADTPEARRNLIEAEGLTDPTLNSYLPPANLGRAFDIAVSTDSRIAVTGHSDGAAVWDLAANRRQHVLRGHRGVVRKVAVGADGGTVYTGAQNGGVRIWDAQSGNLIKRFFAHDSAVTALAPSADGQYLAAGFADGTIKIYRAVSPFELVSTANGNASAIRALAFVARADRVISGDEAGTLLLWNIRSGERLSEARANMSEVLAIHQPLNGSLALSVSQNGEVTRFAVAKDRISIFAVKSWTSTWDSPLDDVSAASVSPAGDRLALGTSGGRLQVWDLVGDPGAAPGHGTAPTRGQPVATLRQGGRQSITAIAFLPNARDVISVARDDSILRSTVERGQSSRQPLSLSGIASPDGHAIAPSGVRALVRLSQTEHDVIHLIERRVEGKVRTDCATPLFFTAEEAGFGLPCRLRKGDKEFRSTRVFGFPATLLRDGVGPPGMLSTDRRHEWHSSGNVIDLETGVVVVGDIKEEPDEFKVLAERNIALFRYKSRLHAVDTRTGRMFDWKVESEQGRHPAFWVRTDGRSLLTKTGSDRGGTVFTLWDTGSWQKKGEWRVTGDPDVFADAARNAVVLVRGERLSILLLEGAQPREADLSLPDRIGKLGRLKNVTFSRDGRYVLTDSEQIPRFVLWEVATAKFIDTPYSNMVEEDLKDVRVAGFAGDGDTLFAVTKREVLFEDANVGSRVNARACAIVGRSLTRAEWARYLGRETYRETCPRS